MVVILLAVVDLGASSEADASLWLCVCFFLNSLWLCVGAQCEKVLTLFSTIGGSTSSSRTAHSNTSSESFTIFCTHDT